MHNPRTEKAVILFWAAIAAVLAILVLLPLASLFIKAFQNTRGEYVGLVNFYEYFTSPGFFVSLRNSSSIAFWTTVIAMPLAFFYAYGLSRTGMGGKGFLKWIAMAPLFAPTMTHGIALVYLFGKQGLVTQHTGLALPIYGFLGIIISEILYVFPSLFLMFYAGLESTDYRLYEVADVMGLSRWQKFRTITLPAMRFPLVSGFFAAFSMSFTDFGAPKMIGGSYPVLAIDVFKHIVGLHNFQMGAAVGIFLILPALLAFCMDSMLQNKNVALDARAARYVIHPHRLRDQIFMFFNGGIAALILLVMLTIVFAAFVKNWPYELALTTQWFHFTIMGVSGFEIFANSVLIALMTAAGGTVLSLMAAYAGQRLAVFSPVKKGIHFLAILPNAIPGLSIGISYIFFFNHPQNPLHFIYGTFWILICANIMHFFTTPYLTMTNTFKRLDPEYENISESMGVPWYTALIKVILPISLPAIMESFAYYFVNAMVTISAVVFLYAPATRVATIAMIDKGELGEFASAAAVAVMIIGTNMLFRLGFDVWGKKIGRA